MSFFDSILLNVVCILFPLFAYLIYLIHSNNVGKNIDFNDVVFELVLVSTIFLIIKLTPNDNYTTILLNIPLLLSYIRGKKIFSIFLSMILILYFSHFLKYNFYIVVLEYTVYYVLYILKHNKNFTSQYIIDCFTIIKAFFLSLYIYYVNINGDFLNIFNNIFISLIVFYVCTNLYNMILMKGEEMVNLNNSLKELEKEKTLRNSLFKLTHEIKNPIAVCKGYLDMLNLDDSKSSRKYISIIKNEIQRTLVLMNDFLDYTKVKVDKNIMDINFLLEDTINSVNSLFKSNNVLSKINVEDEEIYIDGDYNRLKQVIVNILKNCIESKVEDRQLKIELKTSKQSNKFIITIKDNGIGMTQEELNSLGNAFYTTKKKGTGLGVLLSKEIIELHDGEIIYTSVKGKGTMVDIIIPILDLKKHC